MAYTSSEGGFFKCHLNFPKEYPQKPPKMKFLTEIWHPNIEKGGNVCISILHEPGEDRYGYEKAAERWLPVHTVETILISVISMLADPNFDSPANVDAAVSASLLLFHCLIHQPSLLAPCSCLLQKEWRENPAEFKRKVARCVRRSQELL